MKVQKAMINTVYMLYTARKHWRLKFCCVVTDTFMAVPISKSSRVTIGRYGELVWRKGYYPHKLKAHGLTILWRGRIIIGGGRILAS